MHSNKLLDFFLWARGFKAVLVHVACEMRWTVHDIFLNYLPWLVLTSNSKVNEATDLTDQIFPHSLAFKTQSKIIKHCFILVLCCMNTLDCIVQQRHYHN